jgi:hypothetical protein
VIVRQVAVPGAGNRARSRGSDQIAPGRRAAACGVDVAQQFRQLVREPADRFDGRGRRVELREERLLDPVGIADMFERKQAVQDTRSRTSRRSRRRVASICRSHAITRCSAAAPPNQRRGHREIMAMIDEETAPARRRRAGR